MNQTTAALALLAALTITGCARREESAPATTTEHAAPAPSLSEAEAEKLVPKATITPVTVAVTLSPQARALLAKKSEKILVVANYSGDPKASEQAQKMADPASSMIRLGENKHTLESDGAVTFQDDVIDKTKLDFIVGEVQLTINVTSAKTAVSENLLNCPFYWETLAKAGQKTVQIACTTFTETKG